jgi:AcrR family transcriptional regulator
VGTGTLYRHFPTKEALFEAVVIGRSGGSGRGSPPLDRGE